MKKLLNLATAVVDIKVTGAGPEELANRLAEGKIPFWNVKIIDPLCWHISMYAKDYVNIRPLAKKAMCHTHLLKRRGFPFFARKMGKRKLLLGGLTLCLAAVLILPMFVWSYTVIGCDTVPETAIIRALDEIGIGIGAFGPSIQPTVVETKMLLKIPELSYLTINVKGGTAEVIVAEERQKPEILDESPVTDLVAANTGIITKMEILRGRETVKVGQTVLKGEVLVQGIIRHMSYEKLLSVQTVRSMGEVYARTWRRLTAIMPLNYLEKTYTGRSKERFSLLLGKKKLNFFVDSGNSYAEYDKITESRYLTLPGGISFPLGVRRIVICEYSTTPALMPRERAEEMLRQYLMEAAKDSMTGGQILSTEFYASEDNGLLTVSAVFECEEQIALEVVAVPPTEEDKQQDQN